MNEISFIKQILKKYNVSNVDFANAIGATRQQITNWSNSGNIPKKYLLPTSIFLTSITKKHISVEEILSTSEQNNSERFGAIKILREKHNGTTEV